MKKLLFAALLIASVSTSAFASDANKVNVRILNNFKSEFYQASNVAWSVTNNYAKATFTHEGEQLEAFYDLNGVMLGTSKKITIADLPTSAKRTFAKKYSGYNVKEAIKFEDMDETSYYISAENEKESVILRVQSENNISLFKRTAKP